MTAVKTAVEPESPQVGTAQAATWARVTATFFGLGYLRPGPGTWASLATVLLWRGAAAAMAPALQAPAAAAVAAFAVLVGIPAGTQVARATGKKDPSVVVIDEVAGQMIALIGSPLGWKSLLVSFILFRAFDIVKPPPLRRLERLPEGTGIMLDDVGAGVYALGVARVLMAFGWL